MNRIIKKLKLEEHSQTCEMWRDIFVDDTEAFIEYYYKFMGNHNTIYIAEDMLHNEQECQLASMLHLNPYTVCIKDEEVPIHYIVAVATKEKYRCRGLMGELLRQSLHDMYDAEELFAFLMPVAEKIYLPYDFTTVCNQLHYECMNYDLFMKQWNGEFATQKDCSELAEFANEKLSYDYSVYTKRTKEYFEQLIEEQSSQKGGIVVIKEENKITGYFLTAFEGYRQVREPMLDSEHKLQLQVKEKPDIMVRAVHLEAFLNKFIKAKDYNCELEVVDTLISENTGVYKSVLSNGEYQIKKVSSIVNKSKAISIAKVTRMILEKETILFNEIV